MASNEPATDLLLCIPNFSEGRRAAIIEELVERSRDPEVRLLHQTSDVDHDRTVLTWLGPSEGLARAVKQLAEAAIERLDLGSQRGAHPRLGVLDVVPFVPVGDTAMHVAIAAARSAGEQLAQLLPVFFYENAASSLERRDLAAHRRGGLDTLSGRIEDQTWLPDLGPHHIERRSGVVLVAARSPLIAFNVDLSAPDPGPARRIAGRIRQSAAGGLPGVKALGLAMPSRDCSQVSMNVIAPERTSLFTVVQRIRTEAEREGVSVLGSELIGLVARDDALAALAEALSLQDLAAHRIVEHHLYFDPYGSAD